MHDFLLQFEDPAFIGLLFANAYTGDRYHIKQRPEESYPQAENVAVMRARLRAAITERLQFATDVRAADMRYLLTIMDGPMIEAYCEIVGAREWRDPKKLNGATVPFIEPSDKQKDFLARLGVLDFRGSREEASGLIDELLQKRNNRRKAA